MIFLHVFLTAPTVGDDEVVHSQSRQHDYVVAEPQRTIQDPRREPGEHSSPACGQAREVLKSLLGATITLHPCADGVERYLTAEVTGDYAGLLRLAIGKNKAGGGQGS